MSPAAANALIEYINWAIYTERVRQTQLLPTYEDAIAYQHKIKEELVKLLTEDK